MKPLPKGHRSLFDPAFKYRPAANTDIRETFARVRERIAAEKIEHKVIVIGRKG